MQYFSLLDFTAKMTRTQNSQKLHKTMLQFFYSTTSASMCLLWVTVCVPSSLQELPFSTLNYFTLLLKENLCNKNGILLHLSPPCCSTHPLMQNLICHVAPIFITTILHKQKKRGSKVIIHLFIHSTNTWNPIRRQELGPKNEHKSVAPLTAWWRGKLKK